MGEEHEMRIESQAFEKNLSRKARQIQSDFLNEIGKSATQLFKIHLPEIYISRIPEIRIFGREGSSYDPARVDATFIEIKNRESIDEQFEKIAMDRFEKNLENLRWVFEKGAING